MQAYDAAATETEFSYCLHHVQLALPPGGEEECRDFYIRVLGLTEVQKPANLAARGGLWFLATPFVEIHLGVEEAFTPARKAHPGIVVGDLDALAARLSEHDRTIEWGRQLSGHAPLLHPRQLREPAGVSPTPLSIQTPADNIPRSWPRRRHESRHSVALLEADRVA